jgi:hypothetical protein
MSISDGFSLWVGKILADLAIGGAVFLAVGVFWLIFIWLAGKKK